MRFIVNNLKYAAAFAMAVAIGSAGAKAFGQGIAPVKGDKADVRMRSDRFCSSDNWSGDNKVSYRELREMTVAANGTLSVDGGQNGGISVKGENRGDVLIRACVQAWGSDDSAAKALASSIQIGTGPTVKAEAPEEKNWSVSYQILVPRSTSVDLKAHNGGIAINGVDGTEAFETTNGGVSLSDVAGSVKGSTRNGGVSVNLSGSTWKGSGLDVTTTNGGVHINMPANYAAHVETGTVNGGFSSDIAGLAVQKLEPNDRWRGPRPTKISTDLNGGGAPIRVTTTNGGVHISSEKD